MNRKNLTAAVLAGLAGVAGIAGTAQAVNVNPDGLGQVLVYPYYTANDGNQTILSVVNTTDQAKAVKVRFLEGFNSREVLDFNLYMSHHDVWVAAIYDDAGTPTLMVPDTSCTVPYLYEFPGSKQAFLDIRYKDNGGMYDYSDMGPEGIGRAAEGHFEIIEMGSIDNDSVVGEAVTHDPMTGMPADCAYLTELWTQSTSGNGDWFDDAVMNANSYDKAVGNLVGDVPQIMRNSGGLFGGASIVNAENGTMFSYDAIAVQGFDKFEDELGLNFVPGTIYPSLNSGDQTNAWVFFGPPTNEAAPLDYYDSDMDYSVDAVSAVFMHSNIVNEYSVEDTLNAGTEWIITFPTKNFYADWDRMCEEDLVDSDDCDAVDDGDMEEYARRPFTKYFGETQEVDQVGEGTFTAPDCEIVFLKTWDREENTFEPTPDNPSGENPPQVSPSIPSCNPLFEVCDVVGEVQFQLCNEVNVLRFGDRVVFGTPTFTPDEGELLDSLLLSVDDEFSAGWGRIRFDLDEDRYDAEGLIGLPVTGFSAYEFENGYIDGGSVKSNYGGLFRHRGLVSRMAVDRN